MDILSNPTGLFVAKRKVPVAGERDTFAASSDGTVTNFLSAGDTSTLRITAESTFILGGWVNVDTLPASFGTFITKGDIAEGEETYSIGIRSDAKLNVSAAQTSVGNSVNVLSTGTLDVDTDYFVLMWSDPASDLLKVSINMGVADTVAIDSAALTDFGGSFTAFANPVTASWGLDGTMDEWFFCKNPASLANALTLIDSTIYAAGVGAHYSDLTSGNKTTLGLVSWWTFDEESSQTRQDSHGTNHLTLNGTISAAAKLV